jgi:hypothetical protein
MKPDPRILQIPLPGGSGRVPTGAVQFQDDWPGLFVRGDDAIFLRSAIRHLQERLAGTQDVAISNALLKLRGIADIIEQQVIVRGHVPTLKPLQ